MTKYLLVYLLILIFYLNSVEIVAQNPTLTKTKRYIYFTDKSGVKFNPYEYFSKKTIQKRKRHGISLRQKSDKPVKQAYIQKISPYIDALKLKSRWLNMAVVYLKPNASESQLVEMACVKKVTKPGHYSTEVAAASFKNSDEAMGPKAQALAEFQTKRMKGNHFERQGLTGKGVCVAIFDVGFNNAKTNPYLDHLFDQNQVKKTYNFVNEKADVYGYSSHGTNVLSCIGGKHNNVNLGLARDAEFLLARTERMITEIFAEEENWLKAAEWADKHGADIINSSLGYLHHRYFPKDMDGQTSLVAKAARKASKKGILVVNSAGNAGSSNWKYIGTPADVDQVLSVGGTHPKTDVHIDFSSFGPASDHTMKPNVSALGKVVAAKGSDYSTVQGTSFSSPLVAGFAACAWQAERNLTNSQLFQKIEESSHLYPYFDYAHGYGIPQADHFMKGNPRKNDTTFRIEANKDSVYVKLTDTAWKKAYKANNQNRPIKKNLYYHIEAANGTLRSFKVLRLDEPKLSWPKEAFDKNEVLRVHFEGYTSKQIIR